MSDHQSKHRPNSAPEQAKKGERIKTVKLIVDGENGEQQYYEFNIDIAILNIQHKLAIASTVIQTMIDCGEVYDVDFILKRAKGRAIHLNLNSMPN